MDYRNLGNAQDGPLLDSFACRLSDPRTRRSLGALADESHSEVLLGASCAFGVGLLARRADVRRLLQFDRRSGYCFLGASSGSAAGGHVVLESVGCSARHRTGHGLLVSSARPSQELSAALDVVGRRSSR
eukprot:673561-Alexandrium_andersonii.AAC.1